MRASDTFSVERCCRGVQDAVSDRTTDVRESNLFDIAAKYSDILPEDAAIRYLTRDR